MANKSKAEIVAGWPEEKQQAFYNSLTDKEVEALLYEWTFWGRPNQQLPPGDWFCWLILSGRGWGKSRSGSETIRQWVDQGYKQIALIGQTKADVRDTMVELGESSILKTSPAWNMPEYQSSKRRLVWPNGAIATIYSGDEPDQLRGPQHEKAWVDELAKFKYPKDTWDNLEMGLRLGDKPQVVVTTTPKPIPIIRELLADEDTVDTVGHTDENRKNLSKSFIKRVVKKYEGTRLGRQELAGEILDDNPAALWNREDIENKCRVKVCPQLIRIVVAIDPAVTHTATSDDTGIVVAGKDSEGIGYVLDDKTAGVSVYQWAKIGVNLYYKYRADRIIGEVNNGGDLVEVNIRTVDRNVSYKSVRASRGKYMRAEPVAALYEQEKIKHVGTFPELEDEMCTWSPDLNMKSPNRLDALVWALTELMLEEEAGQFYFAKV